MNGTNNKMVTNTTIESSDSIVTNNANELIHLIVIRGWNGTTS